MFKRSKVHPVKVFFICLMSFVFAFWTTEVNAQEENSPRPTDKPHVEESNHSPQENVQATFPFFKPSQIKQVSPISQVKRDLPASGIIQEKEQKKNESPSTLSFNIFLYIVDKFKED